MEMSRSIYKLDKILCSPLLNGLKFTWNLIAVLHLLTNWAQEPVSRMFPLLPGPELFFWFVFKTELSMVLEVIQ